MTRRTLTARTLTPLVLLAAAGICASALGQPAKGPNVGKAVPTTTNPPAPPGAQPGGKQPGTTTTPPGNQPTTLAPATDLTGPPAPGSPDDQERVMLPAFAEPVQLSTLVELVAKTLNINMTTQGEVPGTIVFNAPVPVKKSELLGLLDALLEQQGFTVTKDKFGLYTVHPVGAVPVKTGEGEFVTTRVFHTPNLRPSSLKAPLEGQLGLPPPPQGGQQRQTAYIDELGIIVATDTPRRLSAMNDLIQRVLEEASKSTFTRLELKYLAAPIARERALQLVGQLTQPRAGNAPQPGQPGAAQALAGGNLDNLGDRLTVHAQGNALIFRGAPEEIRQVQTVLNVIDVPNNLQPRSYHAGSAAGQIANIARLQGLGDVTTITDTGGTMGSGFDAGTIRQPSPQSLGGQSNQQFTGGPVMVVNEANGIIIYYGTANQHDQLKALVEQLDTGAENIVIGVYKLKNSKADEVAQVIEGLIQNSQPLGGSTLLPPAGQQQGGRFGQRQNQRGQRNQPNQPNQPGANTPRGGAGGGDLSVDTGFVVADVANNQILVKAPAGQQPEFARLIEKLDLRRPQVYVEAKIVAVNWSNDMRLAFETQLLNAGGAGGLLSTNFGLSSFGTGAITAPKTVATTLGGLTGAIVKADMVPIIVNALQTKANARVLSVPQILVNDNEEAEITSVDTQPTTVTTQSSGNPIQTSSGPDEEAGTKFTVEPHISEGGYLSLKYQIELSAFTGTQVTTSSGTLPSPKQVNKIGSDAVTVPSDSTVIVGGLDFDSHRLTRAQIPLLGEIPIIGILFQDRNTNDRTTTLYVFITPRILRDPTFTDLRLLTAGPQAYMKLSSDMPSLMPAFINLEHNKGPEPLRLQTAPIPMTPEPTGPAPVPAKPTPAPTPATPLAPAKPDESPAGETKSRPPEAGPSNDGR